MKIYSSRFKTSIYTPEVQTPVPGEHWKPWCPCEWFGACSLCEGNAGPERFLLQSNTSSPNLATCCFFLRERESHVTVLWICNSQIIVARDNFGEDRAGHYCARPRPGFRWVRSRIYDVARSRCSILSRMRCLDGMRALLCPALSGILVPCSRLCFPLPVSSPRRSGHCRAALCMLPLILLSPTMLSDKE